MLKRLFFHLSLATLCNALAFAQPPIVTIPIASAHPNDGKQMYESYCATCHGMDGRGHGTAANLLRSQPADLSALSRNNRGVYPARHVEAVLEFGLVTPGRGSKTMPAWGPVFDQIDRLNSSENNTKSMRISNLAHYVESFQAK